MPASQEVTASAEQELSETLSRVMDECKTQGATAAEAAIGAAQGMSVTVRMGEVDSIEHHRDKSLRVSLYLGKRKGNASTTDFSPTAIRETVKAAYDIASFTNEDDFAGLVEAELMATELPSLDLYHPWALDPQQAIGIATECEDRARAVDSRIHNSDGATLHSQSGHTAYANSHGFCGAWSGTRHSLVCAMLARDASGMQRDYWYTSARNAADLQAAAEVGSIAAQRTLSRLGARQVATCETPVIFEANIACGLFSHFGSAISGGSLYRKSSFLLDSLDTQIFADHVSIHEQPHLPGAMGSSPFDGDGVATRANRFVEQGFLRSYSLGGYSARKLGMQTTGNASGMHNLTVSTSQLDLAGLLREMGTGLLVTDLMGFGVNAVTGDYSRGASGFWIEGGEIAFPVEEITIASNLKDMFRQIIAIGNDIETRGNIRSGSVLIDKMTLAGA